MHDPCTQAFEIPNFFVRRDKHGYRPALLTIWHRDPCTDGTDDSCGWFLRSRHLNKDLVAKVSREVEYNFKDWFNEAGYPKFSTMGVTLDMYYRIAWQVFMFQDGDRPTDRARRRLNRFMRRYSWWILSFAENPTDSLYHSIHMKFGVEKSSARVEYFASIILSDVMRKLQPWYLHPRWHVHHWEFQFHPWQRFRRRYLDRCEVCGKRGGFHIGGAYSWGKGIAHEWCQRSAAKPVPPKPKALD